MTQPIQEPSTDRALQGFAFARDQIFRRPTQTADTYLPYAWMRWVGSEAITANTVSNPATVGTPDAPYEEACILDPDNLADFEVNLATGCLSFGPGYYYAHVFGLWNGTGSAGETLGTILDYGSNCSFSSNRTVDVIIADSVNQNMRIPTSRFIINASGTDSVRGLVYHTDAGGNDIGGMEIHVVQINPSTDCEFFT